GRHCGRGAHRGHSGAGEGAPAGALMPGMFIDVQVDAAVARDAALAKRLTDVCPVNIFAQEKDGKLRIVDENLDGCGLCGLCGPAAPAGAVRVVKLYES